MKTTEIDLDNLLAAAGIIPENAPILMLNLLRYKEHADYGEDTQVNPCSGREAYFQRYVPAFNKIASGIKGIQPFWIGNALTSLVAPVDESWDDVALVEYPNFAAFRAVVESVAYKSEAAHHRLAALDNWRLIATIKADLPLP